MLNNSKLVEILDHLDLGIVLINNSFEIVYINSYFEEITGYNVDELDNLELEFKSLIDDFENNNLNKDANKNQSNEEYFELIKLKTKDDEINNFEYEIKKLDDSSYLFKIREFNEQNNNEPVDSNVRERLEIAVEAANIGVWDYNIKTGEFYYNDKWAEMLGFDKSELKNHISTWENLVDDKDVIKIRKKFDQHLNNGDDLYYNDYQIKTKSGKAIWIRDVGKIIEKDKDGKPLRAIGVHININDYKEKEMEIRYLSFHDELTGLYNRRYLDNEMERLNSSRNYPISIIMADLDNLKMMNDNFGHDLGDQYIIKSAKIIKKVIRSEDIAVRTGGDEFAILLANTNMDEAERVCTRIRKKFKADNINQKFSIPLGISLGFYTLINPEEDIYFCYKQADKNMYRNKRAKKNR